MNEWEMFGNGPTCIELRDLVLINSHKCLCASCLGLRCGPTLSAFYVSERNSQIFRQAKQRLSRENEGERNWRLAAF